MPDDFDTTATLDQLIAACAAALDHVGQLTESQYLLNATVCEQVKAQLIIACEALARLDRYAPGLACHLSYRERTAAFYQYLVGPPDQLKHDYVYDILRSKIPLLLLEARELRKVMVSNIN